MACEIHANDIGTVFECTIVDCQEPPVLIDISSDTLKEIRFRRPDTTTLIKTGVFKTDGTDGILQYTSIIDDLDMEGTWNIQAKVQLSDGTWYSEIGSFIVEGNI